MGSTTVERIRQEKAVNGKVCTLGKKEVKKKVVPKYRPRWIYEKCHNTSFVQLLCTERLTSTLKVAEFFSLGWSVSWFSYFPQNSTTCCKFSFQESKWKKAITRQKWYCCWRQDLCCRSKFDSFRLYLFFPDVLLISFSLYS